MTTRLSSDQRRLQLVRAALGLLADHPVDQLTTRRLADSVGLSQPALFRHFASKEALFDAVVAYLCRSLEELTAELLGPLSPCGEPRSGRQVLEELLAAEFAFAERHPGALRLLFHDATEAGTVADLGAPLRAQLEQQNAFIGGLIAGAVERGELPECVDSVRAAQLLTAGLQGELLGWHLASGAKAPLERRGAAIAEHFWAGLLAGAPAREDLDQAAIASEELIVFDARPVLEAGRDPFDDIHAAHARLAPGGVLGIVAPFKPLPLIGLFEGRGNRVDCLELEGELYLVVVRPAGELLDLSDLPAPEPMEELLLAVSNLATGAHLVARLPRFPRLLLPRLEERGLVWHAAELPDSGALLHLVNPDPADSAAGTKP